MVWFTARWSTAREGEAVAQPTETTQSRREAAGLSFTAADLPPLMSVPDPCGPYRLTQLQFIWDWNVGSDKAALIREAPVYDGDDPNLLPAIAVIVHALVDRAGVPVPDWVAGHRAPEDVMMFRVRFNGATHTGNGNEPPPSAPITGSGTTPGCSTKAPPTLAALGLSNNPDPIRACPASR